MGEFKVRNLDPAIIDALKRRARKRGVSLEEEVRRTLAQSVTNAYDTLLRRAAACRAAAKAPPGKSVSDSTELIREDRDEWG